MQFARVAASVVVLLSVCAPARAESRKDWVALADAVWNGDLQTVKKELSKHPDLVNAVGYSHQHILVTPLILASLRGNLEIIRLLLENHADINGRDSGALRYALSEPPTNQEEVVRTLLDRGASVREDDGTTVLWDALRNHDPLSVIRLLLDRGATATTSDSSLLSYAADYKTSRPEVIRLLIDHHANVSGPNFWSDVLDPLARDDDTVSLGYVLDAGANPEILMSREACSRLGDDPPYRAGVMEQFLKHHADPNARCGIGGDTALLNAACNGNLALASVYVEHGANVDLADNDKMSPLSCAVLYKHADVVKLLLEHGANTEVRSSDWHETPLQAAASNNDWSTVKLLLEKHANLEATGSDGKTPLLIASSRGNTQVVKLLLASHADESAKDSKGESAIDLATQAGRCDAVAELAHGAQEKTSACLRSFHTLYRIGFDDVAWRMDIEAGLALKPRPSVVPEEARQYFVQANDTFKNSQASVDAKKAIALYKKALVQAPWFAEAWNNLSLAEEKIGDYQEAAWALRNFTLVRPEAAHDRATLDHIYVLEGKTK